MPDTTQERADGLDFVGFDLCLDAHRGRLYGIAYSIRATTPTPRTPSRGPFSRRGGPGPGWRRGMPREPGGRPYSSPSSASNSSTWRTSIRTSRDLLPSKGPTTRCSASWSTSRAARV